MKRTFTKYPSNYVRASRNDIYKDIYDKDGIIVTTVDRDYGPIAVIENTTDNDFCVEQFGLCVPAHDVVRLSGDDKISYSIIDYFYSKGQNNLYYADKGDYGIKHWS